MPTNNSDNYSPVQFNPIVGSSNGTISSVTPSPIVGVPFISQGSSANPSFGTALVAGGGTGSTNLASNNLLLGNGTSPVSGLGNATNGQLPIGSTGSAPVLSTLTAGANVTITNGPGSVIIASTGGGSPGVLFTPELKFNGLNVGMTYAANYGYYSIVGSILFYTLRIELTNKGSSTGQAQILGFPQVIAAGGYDTPVSWLSFITLTTGYVSAGINMVVGSTGANFTQSSNIGGTGFAGMDQTSFSNNSSFAISGFYFI